MQFEKFVRSAIRLARHFVKVVLVLDGRVGNGRAVDQFKDGFHRLSGVCRVVEHEVGLREVQFEEFTADLLAVKHEQSVLHHLCLLFGLREEFSEALGKREQNVALLSLAPAKLVNVVADRLEVPHAL